MKGLGSWEVEDLEHIIEQDGLESMINIFEDSCDKTIEEWLGSDSAPRKKYIQALKKPYFLMIIGVCSRIVNSTRRFLALPSRVLLLARGRVGP